jgi:Protein of unknown function (DUF1173)
MSIIIRGREIELGSPELLGLLAAIHNTKERPLCACVPHGVPMYVARIAGNYYVKRMPGTGAAHGMGCASFEPPPELSGLGEVAGHAIQEDTESGKSTCSG